LKNGRLTGFESRVLRKIIGSKRREVTGGWRKLMKSFKTASNPIKGDGATP
jgi:hypothetical protein